MTETLLNILSDMNVNDISIKSNIKWGYVSRKMADHGYLKSGEQCRNRINRLHSQYYIWRDEQAKIGAERRPIQYRELLIDIFGTSDAAEPAAVWNEQGRQRGHPRPEASQKAATTASTSPDPAGRLRPPKRRLQSDDVVTFVDEATRAQQQTLIECTDKICAAMTNAATMLADALLQRPL